MEVFKLCSTLAYFSFNSYWLRLSFSFASLVCVPVGITSFTVRIKICAITAGIKKFKSAIKKKKKKHDKTVFQFNNIEVLISKSLINSYISHDEFVSVNNVLKEYNEMREEIKKL